MSLKTEPNFLREQTHRINLFEDSTRTHKSFEVAEIKLGLERLDFDVKTSSGQ